MTLFSREFLKLPEFQYHQKSRLNAKTRTLGGARIKAEKSASSNSANQFAKPRPSFKDTRCSP
jgi:hypothetical protein